ncbi:hypothetical protein KI387_041079, partial [Taxus chinensis]
VEKDETLWSKKWVTLVETKQDKLDVATKQHMDRIKSIGKLISTKMYVMEGMVSGMANIVIILKSEGENMILDQLDGLNLDIPDKANPTLKDWYEFYGEIQ